MEAANEVGTSVIVTTVHSPQEFADWLDRATARGTDGALCVLHLPGSRELHRLAAARIPLVAIDPPVRARRRHPLGRHDQLAGRHDCHPAPDRARPPPRSRSSAARPACGPAGPGWTVIAPPCRRPGSAWTRASSAATTSRGRRAGTGHRTALAAAAAHGRRGRQRRPGVRRAPGPGERGLRAPDDLSVVGFDDVPVASWSTPALTTVRQPLAAMAATAFRMLRSDPATAAGEPHHIELATTLVIRESTGPPRR